MIFIIHALLVGFIYLLLMIYFKKYSDVVNSSRKGVIIDATYIRIYILGIVVSLAVVMLLISPIVSFVLGVQWHTIGVILLSCLACVVVGLLMILNIERLVECLESSRKATESHKHDNKKYVKELQLTTYIFMGILFIIPIFTFYLSGLPMVVNYFMTLMMYLLVMYGVYRTTHDSIENMLRDEKEIREQLAKHEARQKTNTESPSEQDGLDV